MLASTLKDGGGIRHVESVRMGMVNTLKDASFIHGYGYLRVPYPHVQNMSIFLYQWIIPVSYRKSWVGHGYKPIPAGIPMTCQLIELQPMQPNNIPVQGLVKPLKELIIIMYISLPGLW
jgi:hypothetical protein